MKKVLRTALLTGVFMIGAIAIQAQEKNDTAMKKMLQDDQKKEKVYSAIMDDPEMKKEMMQRMMKEAKKDSTSCKMMGNMMMKDGHMQDMMMGKMMDGASKDDGMCKKMCMMMMKDGKMMKMMDNMKEKDGKSMGSKEKMGASNQEEHNSQMHKNN